MTTPRYVLGTLFVASVGLSAAQAASFGHSRIVSAPGQPLHLEIPVTQLTSQEIDTLRATPAPAQAWRDAGMTPPVGLDSMRLVLLDGFRPDAKVIQLSSHQVSSGPIVDVLIDVSSASGQQRYQVSLLAQADSNAVQRAGGEGARNARPIDGGAATQAGTHAAAGRQISVRAGDNMFAIARRNAVQGVTVYQMMIALQRANPQAFIEDNVNLVRAGESLTMPDMAALTALSDREARQIFLQHAQAFARYRQRGRAADATAVSTLGTAGQGEVSEAQLSATEHAAAEPSNGGDRLRLSGGPEPAAAGGGASALAAQGSGGASTPDTGASGRGGSQSGANGQGVAAGSTANGQGGTTATTGASRNGRTDGGGVNSAPISLLASSGAIASDAVTEKGSGAAMHPDDQAAAQKGVDESRTRILELEDNVRHLNEALQKTGPVAAEAALEGARSVSEAIKEAIGIVDEDAVQPGSAAVGAAQSSPSVAGQGAASSTGSASTPAASTAQPGAAASSSPVRAEKKVSWFQENMFAVIGSGLALLVLIIAWLLRRASAAKRDIFESDSPITDSMVRDKLAEIDLDLDTPASGGTGRRSS